jgi:hypothetical protein
VPGSGDQPERMTAMNYVNLTPHAITVRFDDGSEFVIPASGKVCRVSSTPGLEIPDRPDHIPVFTSPTFGEVEGLPEPSIGMVYIVSRAAAARCVGRPDVVAPGRAIRKEGKVVVTRLVQAPQG